MGEESSWKEQSHSQKAQPSEMKLLFEIRDQLD